MPGGGRHWGASLYSGGGSGGSTPSATYSAVVLAEAATVEAQDVTLAGGAPSALDGFTLVAGYTVLVKDQLDPTENGPYTVTTLGSGANGTWTRLDGMDTAAELETLALVKVRKGETNGGTEWLLLEARPYTLGVTGFSFTAFPAADAVWTGPTYYVNAVSASLVVDGSPTTAFPTVQEAIDAAVLAAYTSVQIIVAPGAYADPIAIPSGMYVVIRGAGPAYTSIGATNLLVTGSFTGQLDLAELTVGAVTAEDDGAAGEALLTLQNATATGVAMVPGSTSYFAVEMGSSGNPSDAVQNSVGVINITGALQATNMLFTASITAETITVYDCTFSNAAPVVYTVTNAYFKAFNSLFVGTDPPDIDGTAAGLVELDPFTKYEYLELAGTLSNATYVDPAWAGPVNIGGVVNRIRFTLSGAGGATTTDSATQIPANAYVTETRVDVTGAFDGGSAIAIGDSADTDRLVTTVQNDPATPATYQFPQDVLWPAARAVRATLTGTSTTGTAIISVWYTIPNP